MTDTFAPYSQSQHLSHCGPCSLSYCLTHLGLETDQDKVRKAAGHSWWSARLKGVDEIELQKAASHFGAIAEEFVVADKKEGTVFIAKVKEHLSKGYPALWIADDGGHWMALLGLDPKGRIIAIDPNSDNTRIFETYSKEAFLKASWCKYEDESSEYSVVLISPKNGRPPAFRLTPDLMKMCRTGSHDSLLSMIDDLKDITHRSGGIVGTASSLFADYEETILGSISHWVEISPKEVRDQYRDYSVVTDAMGGITIPQDGIPAFVAQMTALLVYFANAD